MNLNSKSSWMITIIVETLLTVLYFIAVLMSNTINMSSDAFLKIIAFGFIINLAVLIYSGIRKKHIYAKTKRWQYIWFLFYNIAMIFVVVYRIGILL